MAHRVLYCVVHWLMLGRRLALPAQSCAQLQVHFSIWLMAHCNALAPTCVPWRAWLTMHVAAAQTRLQAKGSPYRGSADVVRHIVREQGVQGLWVGSTPSMVRGRSAAGGALRSF